MERMNFENRLFNLITDFYEGTEMPEKVLVSISNDLEEMEILESEDNVPGPEDEFQTVTIGTENLSDAVSEIASTFFDERIS